MSKLIFLPIILLIPKWPYYSQNYAGIIYLALVVYCVVADLVNFKYLGGLAQALVVCSDTLYQVYRKVGRLYVGMTHMRLPCNASKLLVSKIVVFFPKCILVSLEWKLTKSRFRYLLLLRHTYSLTGVWSVDSHT